MELTNDDKKTKFCKHCGKIKPLADFHANHSAPDGLQTYCKDCKKQINREHQQKYRYKNVVALNPALEDFQSRELIAELKARGYSGELKITQTVRV